jgi:prevent-host-death family protein
MPQNPKKYTISEARGNLTDILNKASYGKERIEVVRRNKPIAYIVPIEDVELLEKIEDLIDIADALKRKDEDSINLEELRKELDL